MHLSVEGAPPGAAALPDAIITDASFTGVSTQYLVRLPSGHQLTAFAQNTGLGGVLPVGERVTVSWEPAHAFGLDGSEDAAAGVETLDEPAGAGGGHAEMASLTPVAAADPGRRPARGGSRRSTSPAAAGARRRTCCCCPGMAWLVLFFAVPVFALGSTSLQTRVPGAEVGTYEQTFRWANYTDALTEYAPQFARSFLYAGLATVFALLIGYPLAYAIALRAGRWRNLLLVAVIAPFFTSFILRTIAWKQVLADEGPVVGTLRAHRHPRRHRLAHRVGDRGGGRADVQLPAVHGAAALRVAGAARPAAGGGRRRPLRVARRSRSAG